MLFVYLIGVFKVELNCNRFIFMLKNLNFRWKISFLFDCFFFANFLTIFQTLQINFIFVGNPFSLFQYFLFQFKCWKSWFFPKCFEIIVNFRFNAWILWHGKKLLLTCTSFIDQLVHIVRVEGTGYRGLRGYPYFSQLGVSLYFSTWKSGST